MNCPLCGCALKDAGSASQLSVDGARYRKKKCENGHRIAVQKDGKWRVSVPGRKRIPWTNEKGNP